MSADRCLQPIQHSPFHREGTGIPALHHGPCRNTDAGPGIWQRVEIDIIENTGPVESQGVIEHPDWLIMAVLFVIRSDCP